MKEEYVYLTALDGTEQIARKVYPSGVIDVDMYETDVAKTWASWLREMQPEEF